MITSCTLIVALAGVVNTTDELSKCPTFFVPVGLFIYFFWLQYIIQHCVFSCCGTFAYNWDAMKVDWSTCSWFYHKMCALPLSSPFGWQSAKDFWVTYLLVVHSLLLLSVMYTPPCKCMQVDTSIILWNKLNQHQRCWVGKTVWKMNKKAAWKYQACKPQTKLNDNKTTQHAKKRTACKQTPATWTPPHCRRGWPVTKCMNWWSQGVYILHICYQVIHL